MRAFDFAPLLRSTVGFDRFDRLFELASRLDEAPAYPPYNIEKSGENDYRISMAVAGFREDELNVVVQQNTLLVTGKSKDEDKAERQFLHRGIAARAFERRFELADTIKVTGAAVANGLLHIDLVRVVPEELKPRQIKIATAGKPAPQVIDAKAA